MRLPLSLPADSQCEVLEVGKLTGISVAVNREAFEQAVRNYYQSLVTSTGFGKHLAKDKGFRTQGDELALAQVVEL